MLRAAALKDVAAVIAPAPFVERTQAWPRSPHTELICGMFGIGTPPFDGFEIAGTWMTLNERPDFLSVSAFHGPVIQNAACPLRNAFWAAELSTFELIRPSLFHLSIRWAFLRKVGFATPMSDGSRLPALLVPKM